MLCFFRPSVTITCALKDGADIENYGSVAVFDSTKDQGAVIGR